MTGIYLLLAQQRRESSATYFVCGLRASALEEEKLQAARRWLRWQENRWQIAAVIVAAVEAAASVATFRLK
jgi:hypothetical protein